MTGKERIKSDLHKYMIAIIMMTVLCGLAVAGRAQISALEESGQIVVEKEDEETADNKETAESESPPSDKISEKVSPKD